MYNNYTNLFKLSKTLRFALKPHPTTRAIIEQKGLITKDKQLYEDYLKIKKIIDEHHKFFIEAALQNCALDLQLLNRLFELYNLSTKTDNDIKEMTAIKTNLIKTVAAAFTNSSNKEVAEMYKNLFGAKLFKEYLLAYAKDDEEVLMIKKFDKFTTYFKGYHDNRKNMYAAEAKSTAIAYRLIEQNLFKHFDNIKTYQKLLTNHLNLNDVEQHLTEQLINEPLNNVFALAYYNQMLTQKQITIYNGVIGGYTPDFGQKIQGINEVINLKNQTLKSETIKTANEIKTAKLPKLKPLFKQILSDKQTASWVDTQIDTDEELIANLNVLCDNGISEVLMPDANGQSLGKLFEEISNYDENAIFIDKLQINQISNSLFDDWELIINAIRKNIVDNYNGKKKINTKEYEQEIDKQLKSPKFYSIAYIDTCINAYEPIETKKYVYDFINSNIEKINEASNKTSALKIELSQLPSNKKIQSNTQFVALLKATLDSYNEIIRFTKIFKKDNEVANSDAAFYAELEKYLELFIPISKLYNNTRNYLTKKPGAAKKIKLNFDNATLAAGWDENKLEANTCTIFLKENKYYLGVLSMANNKVLRKPKLSTQPTAYQRMVYKLLPGANKMLPKVFYSKEKMPFFNPSQTILDIRNHSSHTKGGTPQTGYNKKEFNVADCRAMIDFYKASLNKHAEWKEFGFKFTDTNNYETIDQFYKEVEHQGYSINFQKIDESFIENLVADGSLLLFEIYNKDFSDKSTGKKNLHTLYWQALFSPENLKNVQYKLNGEAELFYRDKVIADEDRIIHQKGELKQYKNKAQDTDGAKFKFDIVKDKRFTVESFQLHVPIAINFKADDKVRINDHVNEDIKNDKFKHIIGVDRGERHLLYYTIVDLNGNIVKQGSFNEINNNNALPVNYHNKLTKIEGLKMEQRLNWMAQSNIKEFKQGYLSAVVHQLLKLSVTYQALIVLENLNSGFVRGRQKVEKAVYQQFETKLASKLHYAILHKDAAQANEIGGVNKALQLAMPWQENKAFIQNGIMYYVPAWNTSKIDPVTGFVNFFYTKYETINTAKQFYSKFANIKYNSAANYFEFEVDDYSKFNTKADTKRKQWTICTHGERITYQRKKENNSQPDAITINLTAQFIDLFKTVNIDYTHDLQAQIIAQTNKDFFVKLYYLFKLTLQMRNSNAKTNEDYLISPIMHNEQFFDSRNYNEQSNLPCNADANGAYNIARKGVMIINQLKANATKLDLSNKNWLAFAQ